MALLTPCAPETPEEMLAQIDDAIAALRSEPLRKIVGAMLTPYREQLAYFPAAQRIHHAERSGLLHHTTGCSVLQGGAADLPERRSVAGAKAICARGIAMNWAS